jgi:two-component system sensor histidine kinase KdpD
MMRRSKIYVFWRAARWCVFGGLGVLLLTLLGSQMHLGFAPASFCYLLLLVLQSLSGDFIASAMVSFLAVGCLEYFFVEPVFSFRIARPLDILGLVAFLVTGLTITRLVTKVQAKTESSRLQHEKLQRLYDLAQQLLGLEPDGAAASNFLEPFHGVFGIRTACLFDAVNADVYIAGDPSGGLEEKTGEAFIHGKDYDDREYGISVRCVRVGSTTTGAVGFEGLEDPDLTAGPLAALAAAHLERKHAFLSASRAAATAQTESYRSTILDVLAHEFKTPLSTILAAAGSLREADSLGPHHREMAETVELEAARLGRLTCLIRTARLEREEVKPWIELLDLTAVIEDTVAQHARQSVGRRMSVVKECESSEVLADPELLRLAVSQLIDNACKYSTPGSTVTLRADATIDSHWSDRIVPGGKSVMSLDAKVSDLVLIG